MMEKRKQIELLGYDEFLYIENEEEGHYSLKMEDKEDE